jgi:GntR family transcriptional regulator
MTDATAKTPRQPRYAWLRELLLKDIDSGKYPIGSLLPPENELSRRYDVSRHTVREAFRKLADNGLISRRAGIGTIVCEPRQRAPHVAALGSLPDLFEYTNTTRLEVLSHADVVADGKLADVLGCEPDSRWLELRALRHVIGQELPIAFVRIHLRPEFGSIRERLRGQHMSIYGMLEKYHGQTIHTVKQEIAAALMPSEAARLLDVKSRSPTLHLQRTYSDRKQRLLAVSSNWYPADRFRLSTSWTRGARRKLA